MIYKFGDLFEWTSGKPITPTFGNIPVFGSNGIIGYTNASKYENKIILGRVGAYCGSVMYYKNSFNATDNTLITTCNTDKITYLYAYYLLKQYNLNKFAGGAAQPLITQTILKKLKCEIPTLENQNDITNIIEKYDLLLENNNKRIQILEQLCKKIYSHIFAYKYAKTEKNRLSEFNVELESGKRPKGGIDSSIQNGIPSLGAESIDNLGVFDFTNVKQISEDFYNNMKTGIYKNGDILIYKDGAYIGKTTLFKNEYPFKEFAVNEHVFLLRCKNEKYQNYIYFTLNQKSYFELMQILNRNAAQPGLTKPDILKIKLNKPELDDINKFNEIVNPILDEIFNLAKKNQNLIKQRDLLLPRLMSGKLEVK